MKKYKKMQKISLIVLGVGVLVNFAGLLVRGRYGTLAPALDWIWRLNGVIMMTALAVLAFASVRSRHS